MSPLVRTTYGLTWLSPPTRRSPSMMSNSPGTAGAQYLDFLNQCEAYWPTGVDVATHVDIVCSKLNIRLRNLCSPLNRLFFPSSVTPLPWGSWGNVSVAPSTFLSMIRGIDGFKSRNLTDSLSSRKTKKKKKVPNHYNNCTRV
jgi:hypothetical protein